MLSRTWANTGLIIIYKYVYHGIHMSVKNKKVVWSLRVSPEVKEWFEGYAKERMTDPAEEARVALADFVERKKREIRGIL